MPDIDASIYQPYRDQGVIVLGVHGNEPPDLLADFVEQTGVSFPLVDDQGTIQQLQFPDGVGYPYPKDVIIDKDLTIRSIKNSFDVDEATALIEQLLAE